jgi:hypothetical protein
MMKGTVHFRIANKDKQKFSKFSQGLRITGDLFGNEHVYWAKNHKHDLTKTGKIKHLVPGDDRREAANILIQESMLIAQLDA